MKIDKTTMPLPASQIGEMTPRAPNAKPGGTTPTSENSVHLGNSSAQLRNLGNSVANAPVINTEKVAAIKQAISEGRFQVNNGAVADRLIESVKELISTNKS